MIEQRNQLYALCDRYHRLFHYYYFTKRYSVMTILIKFTRILGYFKSKYILTYYLLYYGIKWIFF